MALTLAVPGRGQAPRAPPALRVGDYVWVEAVGNNQQDNPDIGGIVMCLRDIGARVAAQELFRSAFDAAPIGMALVAPDGRFLQVNRSLSEMLGYPPEVLVTMTFQQLTHPHDLEADLALVGQMLAGSIDSYTVEKRVPGRQRPDRVGQARRVPDPGPERPAPALRLADPGHHRSEAERGTPPARQLP